MPLWCNGIVSGLADRTAATQASTTCIAASGGGPSSILGCGFFEDVELKQEAEDGMTPERKNGPRC